MQNHPTRTVEQIAWAAGLFEGEGCWNVYPRVRGKQRIGAQARLSMTDQDVVERFAAIVDCGGIRQHAPKSTPLRDRSHHKRVTDWYVYNAVEVRRLIGLFMPYLGNRRRAMAESLLEKTLQIAAPNSKKTHCPQGHELTADNVVREPFKGSNGVQYIARRCRQCRTVQTRDRIRKKLGITPERFRIKE